VKLDRATDMRLAKGLPPELATAVGSLYSRWYAMKRRCDNPKDPGYADYGGRGIFYCAGLKDFLDYVEVVIRLPPKDVLAAIGGRARLLWLDRIDNDGGYCCGQCEECAAASRDCNIRWSTPTEQAANKRPRGPNKGLARRRQGPPWGEFAQRAYFHLGVPVGPIAEVLCVSEESVSSMLGLEPVQ
jgi:hypothetical protein